MASNLVLGLAFFGVAIVGAGLVGLAIYLTERRNQEEGYDGK